MDDIVTDLWERPPAAMVNSLTGHIVESPRDAAPTCVILFEPADEQLVQIKLARAFDQTAGAVDHP